MKKLIEKDKKVRKSILTFEKQKFILKSIYYNKNFFNLIRWNAGIFLTDLPLISSKTRIVNRCSLTISKKKFNKLTNFSRIVFFKLAKSRNISNLYKST